MVPRRRSSPAFVFGAILLFDKYRPVSYTHLDVYKRQALGDGAAMDHGHLLGAQIARGLRGQDDILVVGQDDDLVLSLIHI